LLGRQREQQVLADLLAGAREGRSGVMVIRGVAGIGKTSLLQYVLARASGFRAIKVTGSESEMELAYAGLHQLCGSLLGRVDRLPPPQQRALQIALGLADGDTPDRLIVGLAVLTLLCEASRERPTVVVVDDAQWVDAASMQALAFVARRLLADPVALLFAACKPRPDGLLMGLPEITLRGLSDHDARTLLAATVPGHLNEQMRSNIVAEAGGNPLALTELHRVLSPAELAGGFGLADATQLASKLEHGFTQRLSELPAETKTLLLIAAADPLGERTWLLSAAQLLDVPGDALEAAEAAGLVAVNGRIRFRHPLIRSAVYRGSTPAERRRAHAALAEVIDGPAADEHRAWHLAHTVSAPDETIAAELENAAEHARARSGVAAAAAFLAFAADLTPDPDRRVQRALAAARGKLDAGAPEAASKLLTGAQHATDDELLAARIDLLLAASAAAARRSSEATSLLMTTAKRLIGLDAELARETFFEALTAAILAGRLAIPGTCTMAVAVEAREAPQPEGRGRLVDQMLDGLVTRVIDGYVAGAPLMASAIDEFRKQDAVDAVDPRWYDMATRITLDLFDHDAFEELSSRQLELLRSAGLLASLPVGLATRAAADVFAGRLSEAAAHIAEGEAITTAIGGPQLRRSDPLLAAYRGQSRRCLEIVQATLDGGAVEHGQGFSVAAGLFASAVLHNGLGQYGEALSAAEQAVQYDDVAINGYALVELVESAARCGDLPTATDALNRLVERTEVSGTETALGLAARSRALISDGPAAEAEYISAIDHLTHSPAVVFLARTRLIYGEWLRRQNRRVDARTQLRAAVEMFSEMGADGFAERANRELEATGETVRKRQAAPAVELTTQEGYIARLAREGHTNSEIAAQLFISPRTVEWHMGKIFSKLGVSSRRELRNAELPIS
jgi:DNA-binding CsgD family transcriptional regulator